MAHQDEIDRYEAVRQSISLQIAAPWAASGPMSILGWVVRPWLSHGLGSSEPLGAALLICFNAGLLWIVALTLIVVRREQGSLGWAHVRNGPRLRSPQDPKTGRVGRKVWRWLVPFVVLSAVVGGAPD